ncbi:MAG: hypothetical protein AB1689_11445 [Thermodesulfobacteriota bacterium]
MRGRPSASELTDLLRARGQRPSLLAIVAVLAVVVAYGSLSAALRFEIIARELARPEQERRGVAARRRRLA